MLRSADPVNELVQKKPDSPLGNDIDLQQGDVLSYIMEHEDNEQWWLA